MKSSNQRISLKERLTSQLKKFQQLQGNPSYLARGATIGVFIGFAPVMPLKSMLIITLTVAFSGSTIAGLLSCTLICNPLTYVPLYYVAWFVGDLLLPGRASWEVLHGTMLQMQQSSLTEALRLAGQIGLDTAIVMLSGGCLIAVPFTLISYPLFNRMFSKFREKDTKGEKTEEIAKINTSG